MIKTKFISILILLMPLLTVNAVTPEEKNLSDFESHLPLANWRVRPVSGVKVSTASCNELNSGKVLKIDFAATQKATKEVLFFNLTPDQKDWRKYETFEWNAFCSNPSTYKITLMTANDKTAYLFVPPRSPGRMHYVIALDKVRYLSDLSYLYFYHYTPAPSMVLYIDNLKLESVHIIESIIMANKINPANMMSSLS